MRRLFVALCLCFGAAIAHGQTCSPIGGIGNVQFLDNSGNVLTSGVLYSFVAGTSTQQATFTDSTCTVQNVNPITFGSGARVAIWLVTANFYKFVLCAQNDGASCAGGDILFSVDQVPGGVTGGAGGGGSPFISGSANPATSGILRLATGDAICWRNTANSSNLCFTKDTNDLLTWAGGSIKLPEVATPTCTVGFDVIWADSTAHRPKTCGNGGGAQQIVTTTSGDINTTDQVVQVHFGSTATPLSGTAPTTGQCLQWNGSALVGANCTVGEATWGTSNGGTPGSFAINSILAETLFPSAHTLLRYTISMPLGETACSTAPVWAFKDITSSTVLASLTVANSTTFIDSGALSVAMTGGDAFGFIVTTAGVGCSSVFSGWTLTVIYR